ncbi:ABC transporter-like, ATP-binding domain [Dillenia turbinata]|uniref:ABC transporter-like, ATP-binding domain n=1 Tax=Dillenia turbinata TaxID=194707 RepID=A0AAN8W354_9MAGN
MFAMHALISKCFHNILHFEVFCYLTFHFALCGLSDLWNGCFGITNTILVKRLRETLYVTLMPSIAKLCDTMDGGQIVEGEAFEENFICGSNVPVPRCELFHATIRHVNFSIQPSEMVAIVGPSGGGKGMLLTLLQHLYKPIDGKVRYISSVLGNMVKSQSFLGSNKVCSNALFYLWSVYLIGQSPHTYTVECCYVNRNGALINLIPSLFICHLPKFLGQSEQLDESVQVIKDSHVPSLIAMKTEGFIGPKLNMRIEFEVIIDFCHLRLKGDLACLRVVLIAIFTPSEYNLRDEGEEQGA